MIKYKATTYYDTYLDHIDNGGHTEEFESEYQIKEKDDFRFKNLYGSYLVSSITVDVKDGVVFLLISPDARYLNHRRAIEVKEEPANTFSFLEIPRQAVNAVLRVIRSSQNPS